MSGFEVTDSGRALAAGMAGLFRDQLAEVITSTVRAALADAGRADAYTAEQLAEKWSCHPSSITRLVQKGELVAVEGPGRARLIPASSAAAYLDRKLRAAEPAARARLRTVS